MSYSITEWIISLYPLLAVVRLFTAYSLMPHLLSIEAKSVFSKHSFIAHQTQLDIIPAVIRHTTWNPVSCTQQMCVLSCIKD